MTEPLIISESAKDAFKILECAIYDGCREVTHGGDTFEEVIQTAIDLEKEKAVAELKEESRRQKAEYEALHERHKIDRMVEDRQQKAGEKLSEERDELKRQNAEIVKALELINAEWKSDPVSTACFDRSIIELARAALASTQERKI